MDDGLELILSRLYTVSNLMSAIIDVLNSNRNRTEAEVRAICESLAEVALSNIEEVSDDVAILDSAIKRVTLADNGG